MFRYFYSSEGGYVLGRKPHTSVYTELSSLQSGPIISISPIAGKLLFFLPADSDFNQPRLKLVDDNLAPDAGEFIDFRDAGISEPTPYSSEASSPATSVSTSVSTPLEIDGTIAISERNSFRKD